MSIDKHITRAYFDNYHGLESYETSFKEYFDAAYVRDLVQIVWGTKPPYRLLDAGSASGLTLAEFCKLRIEAWGIEKNDYIHARTPRKLNRRNLLGDVRQMLFSDNFFDFTYETCLGYLPPSEIGRAIKELYRVTNRGIIFASITSDMNAELLKRRHLLSGMRTLMTLSAWAEVFIANGFNPAITDPSVLQTVWRCEQEYNAGDDDWYPNADSLRYCFYTKTKK